MVLKIFYVMNCFCISMNNVSHAYSADNFAIISYKVTILEVVFMVHLPSLSIAPRIPDNMDLSSRWATSVSSAVDSSS